MLSRRLAVIRQQSGFTLIELLIVLVILAVLIAIAVPSYLGFRQRASDGAAKSQLRTAATAAVMYAHHNGGHVGDVDNNAATSGFQGMTTARLKLYDGGIKTGTGAMTVLASKTTQTAYCIRITVSGRQWSLLGPGIAASSHKNNLTCV